MRGAVNMGIGMDIEVHSFSRDISQRRTLLAAAFLLILSCGLAVGMSWRRAANPLVPVLTPQQWKVLFSVPRRFETGEARVARDASALPFFGESSDGVKVFCILWRGTRESGVDLETTAQDILREFGVGVNWFGEARTRPAKAEPMGEQEGLELISVSESAVIRIAAVADEVYAVLFATQRAKLDPEMFRLFDLTCRSMKVQ